MVDLAGEPLSNVEWRDASELRGNTWNPNRVNRAELVLLERSLLVTGWIQPILALPDGTVIDGFHRWRLALDSKPVKKRWAGKVPVVTLNLTLPEAMLMTIRINRAKGNHQAAEMSRIVRSLLADHGYTVDMIGQEIGADRHETELLAQEGVFAQRDIKHHAYSRAWYPSWDSPAEGDGYVEPV